MVTLHPYSFEGTIESRGDDRYSHACVYLPDPLARDLLAGRSRLRVRGEVDELPFAGAWQPSKGRYYLLLSRTMCRAGDFTVGDRVEVRFRLDETDAVTVPPDLQRALAAEFPAMRAWEALTPGRRRGLAHYVASAKTPATVAKRVTAILDGLLGVAALPGPQSGKPRPGEPAISRRGSAAPRRPARAQPSR
jgi:hypothetical protein